MLKCMRSLESIVMDTDCIDGLKLGTHSVIPRDKSQRIACARHKLLTEETKFIQYRNQYFKF